MTSRTEYDRISPDFEPWDLKIDGQPIPYRDPNNPDYRKTLVDQSDEEYEANPNAYNMMNPLYAYSYGDMRKAGEALGITNINDVEEVEQMLEYMSKPHSFAEEAKEEQAEEAISTTPLTDELAQKGAPLSEQLQRDVDFVKEQTDALRDGSFNDSYRRMASGGPAAGTAASDALRAQMSAGAGIINVDEFAKQRALRDLSSENDFARSMFDNSFNNSIFN